MKILHFLQSNSFSGAENVVCQIIGMFKDIPSVEFVYCSPDGQIREALKERNICFHPIKNLSKAELKKAIDLEKPDIIHAHDMRASYIASFVNGKAKIISHIHNNNFDSRGLSIKSMAFLYPALKSSHIFYVSSSAYEGYYFHNLFKKKSSILYNIIDINATINKMTMDKNEYFYDVIFLGRLTEPKNPIRLMSILEKCIKNKRDIKIAIVGNGNLEKETKDYCKQRGIDKNVSFLGYMSNPLKILHDSKVMVMSSKWEGTPMCALEAMSLGVPIVSTPVDGLKDLVVHDRTGYLSDDDEKLASYILKITENNALRNNLSKQSFEKSSEINDIDIYKSKILMVYQKALSAV